MRSLVWDAATAARYDESSAEMFDSAVLDPAVEFLAERAGDGAALEFAIGTGRVAIPLRAKGIAVSGIELSEPMVAVLRDKPGAADLPVTIGDMSTTRVPGEFALVYLVFNTISNLLTQDAQVDCFSNAARHLRPGGRFVIETFVPALRLLPPGQRLVPFYLESGGEPGSGGTGAAGVDSYDTVTQRCTSHHVRVTAEGARWFDSPHRYAFPAELDLMARIAGLHLDERYADFSGSPFQHESTSHVSVWRKPG